MKDCSGGRKQEVRFLSEYSHPLTASELTSGEFFQNHAVQGLVTDSRSLLLL